MSTVNVEDTICRGVRFRGGKLMESAYGTFLLDRSLKMRGSPIKPQ